MIAESGGCSLPTFPTLLPRVDRRPSTQRTGLGVDDLWMAAIDAVLLWMAASGASPATVRLRRYQLQHLAGSAGCGPWDLQLSDLLKFQATRGWSAETRKSHRAAARLLCRYGMLTGAMSEDPSALLPVVRVPPAQPRPAPESAVVRALAMTDSPRDRLMVLLGAYLGLRRSEIAAVHSRDIEGDSLYVRGKGSRVRRIPLPPELLEVLTARPDGFLFPGKCDGHLSPDRVGRIIKGLLGTYKPHQLRHRFSSVAHARGADLLTLTRLCGWSKPETAQVYTATPDQALRAAVLAASS